MYIQNYTNEIRTRTALVSPKITDLWRNNCSSCGLFFQIVTTNILCVILAVEDTFVECQNILKAYVVYPYSLL